MCTVCFKTSRTKCIVLSSSLSLYIVPNFSKSKLISVTVSACVFSIPAYFHAVFIWVCYLTCRAFTKIGPNVAFFSLIIISVPYPNNGVFSFRSVTYFDYFVPRFLERVIQVHSSVVISFNSGLLQERCVYLHLVPRPLGF